MKLFICSVFLSMTLPQHFGMNIRDDSEERNLMEKFGLMGEGGNKDDVIVVKNLNDFIAREDKSSQQQPATPDYDEFMPFSFDTAISELQSDTDAFKSGQQENVSSCRIIRPIIVLSGETNEFFRRNKHPKATINNCDSTDSEGCRFLARSNAQQPLYVEEPGWVEIDPDYGDSLLNIVHDPYIVSRGKKIIRPLNGGKNDKFDEGNLVRKGRVKNKKATLNQRGEEVDNFRRTSDSNERNSSQYVNALLNTFGNRDDPFFLTRGKKMIVEVEPENVEEGMNKNEYRMRRKRSLGTNWLKDENVRLKMPDITDKFKSFGLKKRNTRNNVDSESMNGEAEKTTEGRYTELNKIFNDFQDVRPVFRKGRKACTNSSCRERSMTSAGESDEQIDQWIRNNEIENGDSRYVNDPRLLDSFINARNKKNGLDGRYQGAQSENESINGNKEHPTSHGILLDELLANYDPYYVTRGKKMLFKVNQNT